MVGLPSKAHILAAIAWGRSVVGQIRRKIRISARSCFHNCSCEFCCDLSHKSLDVWGGNRSSQRIHCVLSHEVLSSEVNLQAIVPAGVLGRPPGKSWIELSRFFPMLRMGTDGRAVGRTDGWTDGRAIGRSEGRTVGQIVKGMVGRSVERSSDTSLPTLVL